jgi:cystathionine beta-lyase/cystathionine gamma-synthase
MDRISNRQRGIRTTAIHAGEAIDPVSRASSPNLVMSSTFAPTEVAGFSARNRDSYEGFVYARVSNPTVKQLEDKLSALERAEACQCYASGMAASSALLLGRLSQGDHLVISDTNYVGTAELVRDSLPRFGIEVTPRRRVRSRHGGAFHPAQYTHAMGRDAGQSDHAARRYRRPRTSGARQRGT